MFRWCRIRRKSCIRVSRMNRRAFLAALAGGVAAGASLDPERLLWVPGRKLISIPKPQVLSLRLLAYFDPYLGRMVLRMEAACFPLMMPNAVDRCEQITASSVLGMDRAIAQLVNPVLQDNARCLVRQANRFDREIHGCEYRWWQREMPVDIQPTAQCSHSWMPSDFGHG